MNRIFFTHYLLVVHFIFCTSFSFTQPASITVTSVQQRSDGSGFVDVYYNLSGPGSTYNIAMKASFNGGSSYSPIPPAFLSGDIAGITAGSNKHIVWDGLGSFPSTYSTQARLELTATEVTGSGIPCQGMPAFTDPRDGQTYNTVQIGSQCWMKENLKYLPSVVGPGIGSETVPYYYVYDYDGTNIEAAKATANYQNYGVLYNWPAAMDEEQSSVTNPSGVKGVCPIGWHLPSHHEWTELEQYICNQLGNSGCNLQFPYDYSTRLYRGTNEGNTLKSCRQVVSPLGGSCNTQEHPRWNFHSSHYGTNEFGFSAYPGAYRRSFGHFLHFAEHANWWSATEFSSTEAWYRHMAYNYGNVYRSYYNKSYGVSVRCVRD